MSTRPSGSMAPGQAQRLLTTQEMQYHQNQRSLSLASSYISVTGPRYFYTNQSLISCIGLIISSSLGVGMLTIPKAFSLSGWILGMVNILVCILIVYSVCSYLILLSYRVERVSYYGIAEQIFGRRIGRFCELGFAFTCYLVFVYYLYFLGKLPVEGNKKVNINNTTMNSSELWIGVFTVIVIPIAYFKSIDILKHTCWLSWLGAFVSLIGIIIQFFDMDLNWNLKELSKMPQDAKDYSDSFYLILFACTCQFNILAVYEEFGHRNKDKIKHVMRISLIIVTILYSIIGTLGYLMFNSEDHKTYIIENSFDTGGANNSGIYIVCIAMIFLILGKIHLLLLPCREGIYASVLDSCWYTISNKKHYITVTLLLLSAVSVAYLILEFESGDQVFRIVLDIIFPMNLIVMPCVFFLFAFRKQRKYLRKTISCCVILAATICLYGFKIYSLIEMNI